MRSKKVSEGDAELPLTEREIDALNAVAEGYSTKEAAARLQMAKRTLDFHLYNAYTKLGAKNRLEALHKAGSLGLLKEASTTVEPADDIPPGGTTEH